MVLVFTYSAIFQILEARFLNELKELPVPKKITGLFVAATADNAPPPLAWPSNLEIITDPTSTLAYNYEELSIR